MTNTKTIMIITNLLNLYKKHLAIIEQHAFPILHKTSVEYSLMEYLKDKYLENGVCHAYQWNFSESITALPFVINNSTEFPYIYWDITPNQYYTIYKLSGESFDKLFISQIIFSFKKRISILTKELYLYEKEMAMKWWNDLAHLRKTQICDTNTELLGCVRRWETLTGREILNLYNKIFVIEKQE